MRLVSRQVSWTVLVSRHKTKTVRQDHGQDNKPQNQDSEPTVAYCLETVSRQDSEPTVAYCLETVVSRQDSEPTVAYCLETVSRQDSVSRLPSMLSQ